MAIEVFTRHEKKYALDESTYRRLLARLAGEMELDANIRQSGAYRICNLYYDTDHSALIRRSLSGPQYKEKLRLRTYGTPPPEGHAYFEIKKKVCGLVNKRRSAMPLQAAYRFADTGVPPATGPGMNSQVIREIACILGREPLRPKVYISYERRAYCGAAGLRLSFDTNIITRRTDLRLESGVYGQRLLPEGQWLMEIKTPQTIPLWLARTLSEFRLYPVRFSKYGREYLGQLERDASI
jgi:SPX domain protein involved in polyphosphate accumulation